MNDDELDTLLGALSVDYNQPPEIPREAMWESISRERAARASIPVHGSRPFRWVAAAAGIAAVLVAGVVIGRVTSPTAPSVRTVATVPQVVRGVPDTAVRTEAVPVETTESSPAVRRAVVPHAVGRRTLAARPRSAPDLSNDAGAYRLAVVEHLARTEVLLTDFRANARTSPDGHVAAQFASLSRELLGTTRDLLAAHRTDDPVMTRLLQDLELVLMEISQYAADGRRVDLDAINQSIEKRNVLPKLRSTIPAGNAATSGI